MTRDEVICSILVYIVARRNPYHRQISTNALQLSNGLLRRRVVKLSMDDGISTASLNRPPIVLMPTYLGASTPFGTNHGSFC
jgi:hypothetical protein